MSQNLPGRPAGTSPAAESSEGPTAPRRLSLGCGHDVRPDWVNCDIAALPGVDVVHDLEVFPWPFQDGEFDHVECVDIIEHLGDMADALREIHRILKPGGRAFISGPHFTSYTVPTDPTHRRSFAINTFEFFTERSFLGRGYYFDFSFAAVEHRAIRFQKVNAQPWNEIAERVINRHRRLQTYYEQTALSRLFPAHQVEVVLVR